MKNIVIVGGGAAGLSAAATAAEAGAKVTVLERLSTVQGNGRFAEGVFGAGSTLQKRLNIDADPEKIFKSAMEYSHWKTDARLMRRLIDNSGATVDWLTALGVPFSRVLNHMPNQTPAVFHMAYPAPSGARVMAVLEAHCRELGIEMVTGAEVKELILTDSAVTGVKAVVGNVEKVFPADAVQLSTGGFSGNEELMKELLSTWGPGVYMRGKGMRMNGGGVMLAKQAGADIQNDICVEGAAPIFGGRGEITGMIRRNDCLWVNSLGYRFCDESISENFIYGHNAVMAQPGKMCWAILDSDYVERTKNGLPAMMVDLAETDNGMGKLEDAIEFEMGRGQIFKADTIGELAEKAGLDAAVFTSEVNKYNSDCAAGWDSLFGKDRRSMIPVAKAPFYAVRAGIDLQTTHGGIKTDYKMRVLKADGTAIPGLYAAGIDISGVDTGDYSVWLSGHAFGFSLCGGRIAAGEMVKD